MRASVLGLVALLLLGACDSDDDGGDESLPTTGVGEGPVGVLTGDFEEGSVEVTVDPDPPVAGADARWMFVVANLSDAPLTLTFSSGRRADVALARDGEEVYRWSDGQVFTQAIEEVTVEPAESVTFELEGVLDVDPGSYELTAELASDPAPQPMGRAIEVIEGG